MPLMIRSSLINGSDFSVTAYGVDLDPSVTFRFNTKIDRGSLNGAVRMTDRSGFSVDCDVALSDSDSTLVLSPRNNLRSFSKYSVTLTNALRSSSGGVLASLFQEDFHTRIDSSRKFPMISDDELMDKVQRQTFRYFWDFGHPVSGLSRERNTTPDIVTSGGSGFGIMSIIVGASRSFVTREQALGRLQTIVSFLKDRAQTFHGAFPHWLNGATGRVIPFSARDDGADLVETSYLANGLICAREYFSNNTSAETALRADINTILDRIEWSWFRRNNQNVLYWHWSPNFEWQMNLPIRGWNECLITYIMAGSSRSYAIGPEVYRSGWATGSNFLNGNSYYGYSLPLGPPSGGPLFFAHYSFLGIDPKALQDAYANYETQTRNHTLINYAYCLTRKDYPFAYSDSAWGLTASDVPGGYNANSPTDDKGVIAPTAALSSMPFTPVQSMAAMKFFYYVLGDRLFRDYGFVDAFSFKDSWVADTFLAIDQGPIIVMLENHRTGLIWKLFMQAPEIQRSLKMFGFTSPNIR